MFLQTEIKEFVGTTGRGSFREKGLIRSGPRLTRCRSPRVPVSFGPRSSTTTGRWTVPLRSSVCPGRGLPGPTPETEDLLTRHFFRVGFSRVLSSQESLLTPNVVLGYWSCRGRTRFPLVSHVLFDRHTESRLLANVPTDFPTLVLRPYVTGSLEDINLLFLDPLSEEQPFLVN